jgi:hypothetical protein
VGRVRNHLLATVVAPMTLATLVTLTPFGAARAQGVPAGAPVGTTVDASALRPGEFVYETTLERDNSTTMLGTRTVSAAMSTYAGAPAWVLVEARSANGASSTDSLFADPAGLRPLHWSASVGSARLAAEFRGDTAYGGTSGPPGRRSIIVGMPHGTIVSAAQLETELRLFPLQTAWEDSTSTLFVTLGSTMVLPTRIAVIGEDRVRVPAGEFDCWVVSVRAADATRGLYWVTKRDPIVVRSALDVPAMGGAQYVSALSRIGR